MNNSQETLSKVVVFDKYAKHIDELSRRETYDEIVDRYEQMLLDHYPALEIEIRDNIQFIRQKRVLPSMRAMQFAGPAIARNHSRIYNCAYMPIDDYRSFAEGMFLLLGGTGVGYSVQKQHVEKLPAIAQKPNAKNTQKYMVADDIKGWADAVRHLVSFYFGIRDVYPRFDFRDIRPKGARLITAGGKAPGPEPLKKCLKEVDAIFKKKEIGEKLRPIEAHDIMCHIAHAVLAGGIRRAAMISLFSHDDEEMMLAKSGDNWWNENSQRFRANNSAVLDRGTITEKEFRTLWKAVEESGAGEPGFYFTNDTDMGTNPCAEIALKPYQFCNLTEINGGTLDWLYDSQESRQIEFNERARVAAFFGTLQAGFTDFHYLRPIWIENTNNEALIGVGITGIANGQLDDLDLKYASNIAKEENYRIANIIGINPAARVTTIKPSGTTSCVLGTSSGIHTWYAPYYIRRVEKKKGTPMHRFLLEHNPEIVEDLLRDPDGVCIEIPQAAPVGALTRNDETALEFLERVTRFNIEWVRQGHRAGANTNNVSATVSVRPEEWDVVGTWMWENRDSYNGLSVLPYDGGTYTQAPFEEITEKEYERRIAQMKPLDFTLLKEEDDNTTRSDTVACAGGTCEII